MNVTIVDPPASASGTTLIFDMDSFSMARLYTPESDRANPVYTIRSETDSKHRYLHFGLAPEGAVAGEIVLHGAFKKGLGTVSVAGSKPIPIEEWTQVDKASGALTVGIHDYSYTWTQRPIDAKGGGLYKSIYDVCLDGEVVASWYASHADKHFSPMASLTSPLQKEQPKTIVRAHLVFADGIDTEKAAPELLLSLILVNVLHLRKPGDRSMGGFGFAVGGDGGSGM